MDAVSLFVDDGWLQRGERALGVPKFPPVPQSTPGLTWNFIVE